MDSDLDMDTAGTSTLLGLWIWYDIVTAIGFSLCGCGRETCTKIGKRQQYIQKEKQCALNNKKQHKKHNKLKNNIHDNKQKIHKNIEKQSVQ